MQTLADWIARGLKSGESVIIIATQKHESALRRELADLGFHGVSTETYRFLDADETLEQIMSNGSVDAVRFNALVGKVLTEASQSGAPLRLFGELVALLVARGKAAAAVELEKLWNDLRQQFQFTLLCGYPISSFNSPDDSSHFQQICAEHSHVTPTEDFSRVTESGERLRAIAFLQQQAQTLHAEIAERKRAEKLTAESESRMRHLVNLMPSAVYTCDGRGCITFYNRRAAELWGREPKIGDEELLFCGSFRLWLLDGTELPHHQTPMARAIREGVSTRDEEVVIERPDGSRVVVAVNIDVFRDENGGICGAINVFQDITRRKETESELRRKQAELSAFFENATVGLHAVSAEGIILWVNRAELDLLGYSREEYVGRHIAEFHVDAEVVADILGRLSRGEKLCDHEARMRCKDGSIKYVAIDSSVLWDNGRFVQTQCFTRDITEQRKAEELSKRLAAIVHSSDDAIFSIDLEGVITSWNEGAGRLYGYTAEEIIGRPVITLLPPERYDEEPRILESIRNGQRIDHYETVRRRKDGSLVHISLSVSAIKDLWGNTIGSSKIARDITARIEAEEQLRRSEALFRQALENAVQERTASLQQAVAQMEEFSYTVSHDLRAPLRGMHAYSSALVEDFAEHLPPEAIRFATKIRENAERLDRMILDVLTFSRVARAELKISGVDLNRLIGEMVQQYPGLQPPHANIFIERLHSVRAHEPSLVQAVSNLLGNAVKFAKPGVIPTVRVWSEKNGGHIRLNIQDDGIGIQPRFQHRLFHMFERVHANLPYDGTGVGLAIVRKATERMGGECGVESDGVNGSRFWIQLPATEQ